MKILVTGRNGQVGWELMRSLQPLGEVIAADRNRLDLADLDGLRKVVREIAPDVIVNPAAYTAVDKAEDEEDLAQRINGQAPGVLAEEAERAGALLIHYSTDYVFDGTKAAPYTEDDEPSPVNAYGRSKLAGERAIQNTGADHLILRTAWVYSLRGHNFLRTILRLAQEREELKIVADQSGTPTWARFIAEASAHILRQAQDKRDNGECKSGLYHLTAGGQTTWHGFAQKIVEQVRQNGGNAIRTKQIHPIPTEQYPTPANRPVSSVMSTGKIRQAFGLEIPGWEESLRRCISDKAQVNE